MSRFAKTLANHKQVFLIQTDVSLNQCLSHACSSEVTVISYSPTWFVLLRGIFDTKPTFSYSRGMQYKPPFCLPTVRIYSDDSLTDLKSARD